MKILSNADFISELLEHRLSFVCLLLFCLCDFGSVPRLKKEVIGRPETDWLIVGIHSPVFNMTKQMESELNNLEIDLFKTFGRKILYTFTQLQSAQDGHVMMRLTSRKQVEELADKAEEIYKNTPTLSYWVEKWNPSELEIPDPPHLQLEILGGSRARLKQRRRSSQICGPGCL